jgi:hypothetical protein
MQKKLIFAVIAVFVMMPFASFSKTVISDGDLKDLIAESDTLQLNNITDNSLNLTSAAFSGSGGFTSHANACYAGLSDFNISGPVNIDIGANACYAGLSNFSISSATNTDIDTNGFRTMPDISLPASIIDGANDKSVLSDANDKYVLDILKAERIKTERIKAAAAENAAAAARAVYQSSGGGGVQIYAH